MVGQQGENAMSEFEMQRRNMVDSQVRPSDVTDRRVIRAMLDVPRETFAPAAVRGISYMDTDLPVTAPGDPGPARALLSPRILAKLLQVLDVDAKAAVLDIGGTTGYAAAVLAQLAARVVVVEADPRLAAQAKANLAGVADTVSVIVGPHQAGAADQGPYDVILLEGIVPDVPRNLLDQLKDGGQLAALVSADGVGRAVVYRRSGGNFDHTVMFDAAGPVLPGFERAQEFVF
jgi:protein-L-isoaspartate(D-aspartate) O-methyltransferase